MWLSGFCPYCFEPLEGYGPCPHCGHTIGEPRSGAQQLPQGTILDGKYQLGMVLGQGGFGITYLAYDLSLRMRVAVKEYFPLGLVTRQGQTVTFTGGNAQPFFQKGVEAFYREARLLARFQAHPNIVHVSSFFRQNGTAYFVMEYVEGESLAAYLEKCGGKLSYEETIRLLLPVFDALTEVHNAGILHRDIAPDNICIAKDGNIKLLDFGAAKNELSLHTHSSAAILKPGYAPLEQYTAGSNQGPWTDIYAMGAVIYKCLTGKVPPDAPDRMIGQRLASFKETGTKAPDGAEAAVNKALEPDIQNRWQSAAEFRNALADPDKLKKIKIRTQNQAKGSGQRSGKLRLIPVLVLAAVLLIAAGIVSKIILPKNRAYREGVALIAEGKYEDAVLKLSEISSYRDSESRIRRAKSLQAEEYLALGDYDNAMTLFTELSGKDYAAERIAQRKIEFERLHPKMPEPTIVPVSELPTPEPTSVPTSAQTDLQKRLAAAEAGNIITFGRYEQDGNEENGPEKIEWIVLDKAVDHLFIVSKYGLRWSAGASGLEKFAFISEEWLNSEFLETSFSLDELRLMRKTTLPSVSWNSTNTEQSLQYVFLLNREEVERYFSTKEDRMITGTRTVQNGSNWINNNRWILRERPFFSEQEVEELYGTGKYQSVRRYIKRDLYCTYVSMYGEIVTSAMVCNNNYLIRPAMRISISTIDENP